MFAVCLLVRLDRDIAIRAVLFPTITLEQKATLRHGHARGPSANGHELIPAETNSPRIVESSVVQVSQEGAAHRKRLKWRQVVFPSDGVSSALE